MINFEESNTVEFKRELPKDNRKWLKTVIAFSNTAGGKIYVGIEDSSKKIIGIKDERSTLEQRIAESIYTLIEPKPTYTIDYLFIDGKDILLIEVFKGRNTPYYFRNLDVKESCYVRYGSADQIVTYENFMELRLNRQNRRYSEEIFQHKGQPKVAQDNEVTEFLELLNKNRESDHVIDVNRLIGWDIVKESNGILYETNGYNLMTNNIGNYYSSRIRVGQFQDEDKSIILKDKYFSGNILEQYQKSINFILEVILERYEIVRIRKKIYKVPETVIREIISNAIIHRNYLEQEEVKVEIYSNRIKVVSPGPLYQGLQKEEILSGKSRLRNRNIAEIFFRMGYIENWGSGLMRANRILKDSGRKTLEIDTSSQFDVSVTVYFEKEETKYLNLKEEEFLDEHKEFKIEAVEKKFSISEEEANYLIKDWIQEYRVKEIAKSDIKLYRTIGDKRDSRT